MTFQIFFACVLPSRANHGLKIYIYLKDDLHIKLWQLSSLSQFLQGSCVWMMFTAHLKMNCITLIWISSRHAHIFWRATEWCSLFHIGRLAFESAYVTCIFLVNCLDRIAFDFLWRIWFFRNSSCCVYLSHSRISYGNALIPDAELIYIWPTREDWAPKSRYKCAYCRQNSI